MKKEIQKFDKFIKKETKNDLTAFDETFEIFIELINPEISANQQNLVDRMGAFIEFESVERIQTFFDHYFGYQNKMIEHVESAFSFSSEKEFASFISDWAKNLLQTIAKENRVTDVIENVYYLYESVAEIYGIDLMKDPENSRDEMLRAFGSEEVADMFTFLIVFVYEIEESKDNDEEALQRLVELMISFCIAMNQIRKLKYEKNQNTKALHDQFGGAANQPNYKVGRNDPCPCGSGKKYKKCCLNKQNAPLERLRLPEPKPPFEQLREKEINDFYSMWSRFMGFVGQEYSAMNNIRYRSIYGKDSSGKFYLKESGIKDGYYVDLRRFLVNNFQDLVDSYIASKRVAMRNVAMLNHLKVKHLHSDFYVVEKFANGNAVFLDSKNDGCYYVYRGYDKLSSMIPSETAPVEALLLSYKGRIICDGVMGHYNISMGEGIQSMLAESYGEARENLRFDLEKIEVPEKQIYQLKISIRGAKPPVWRRVLVESSSSFYALHNIIQVLFNWMDCHLHEFEASGVRYADKESLDEAFDWGKEMKDESLFSIDHELVNEKDKIRYVYDFGDDWQHIIELEKILPYDSDAHYPVCTGGRGDSFGEDSGGVYQFGAKDECMGREAFDKKMINGIFGVNRLIQKPKQP